MAKPKGDQTTYYLGNKNLPVPETQFKWTPEMVEDLERARKSILHFSRFFYIVSLDEGKQPIKLYTFQKRVLKALVENRFNVVLASRQIGKTTILTIFALWMICFHDDYRVLLIANKQETAKNIFKRIKLAYEMLPNYMKPGVVAYAKEGMELENGSSIGISTTTSDAARGESINCLLLDEAAFIPPEFMDNFWESVFPVISSSKKSKIFMLSTPNGVGNLFFNTYTDAVSEKNGWHHERVDWHEVPGRDEKWKEMTMRALGSEESFNQEYGNEFRAAGENIFDKDQLDELTTNAPDPVYEDDDGAFKIYKDHIDGHFYSIGVDVGEGISRANSVIQIVDVTDLTNIEQVATYANNKLDPFNFAGKLVEIAGQWGNPPLLVERNNCGASVVDALTHTHQYPNIVKYTPSMGSFTDKVEKDNRLGVYSHTNSKFNSMANFRYWMNVLRCVKLYDKQTIEEFKTYIRQANGVWKKQSDKYLDDRVEALIWAMFILDPKVVEQFYEVTQQDSNGKPLHMIPNNWDPFVVSMPKPSEMYNKFNKDVESVTSRNPVVISQGPNNNNPDMDELFEQGWRLPHGSPAAAMLDKRFINNRPY
jgi:Terminase large subunit, T4likevirus-type, N-terminal